MQLQAERDNFLTLDSMDNAIFNGVDPVFVMPKLVIICLPAFSTSYFYYLIFCQVSKAICRRDHSADDDNESNLEFHYDIFFSTIDTSYLLDIAYNNEEDCETFSAKDRLLNMRLPKITFDPLMSAVKNSKPTLYRALSQLPIFTGTQRGKKKAHRKDKKRERKEKEAREKELKSQSSSSSRKKMQRVDREALDTDRSNLLEPTKYGELLAFLIAKNIAENSITDYLVTIALLLIVNKEDAFKNLESSTIPVANLIAALFDGPVTGKKSSALDGSKESENESVNSTLLNPFRNYLLSTRPVRSKSFTNSESSRYDICSMDENKEETMSQTGGPFFVGAYSETGSTVGSTYAELGTETASVMGDEITEEELLSQALALSMIDNIQLTPQIASSAPLDEQPSQEQSLKSVPKVSVDSAEGSKGHTFPSLKVDNVPYSNSLPKLHPLSTFGPFCCHDFWSRVYSNALPDQSNKFNNSLPVRHIIISLLIVIANGCGCPDLQVLHDARTFDPSENPKQTSLNEDSKADRFPNLANMAPTPNSLKFALLEYLVDFVIQELILHCSNTEYRFLNKGTEGKDVGASVDNSKDTEWYFHLFFLVWCLTTLLKILTCHFQAAIECGATLSAMNLSMGSDISDILSENNITLSPGVTLPSGIAIDGNASTTVRIMQLLADCIGISNPLTGNKSTTLFDAMDAFINGSSVEKDIIDSSEPLSNSILCGMEGNESKLSFCYSGWCFRHHIRISAIHALTSGLQFFIPKSYRRLEILRQCITSSSIPGSIFAGKFHDSKMLFNLLAERDSVEIDQLSSQYYKNYLTQKLCLATVAADDLLCAFHSPSPSTLHSMNSWSYNKQHRLEKLKVYIKDQSFHEFSSLLRSIQDEIVKRLKDLWIPFGSVSPQESLIWGEVLLLKYAQLNTIDQYALINDSDYDFTVGSTIISFSNTRCHPNLHITSDGRVASHQGPKLWATVTATKGLEPDSGTYEWVVRIDKCSKGHVFLGIVTGDANTEKDSYVGVDRGGWGLIGTRSLWHNKSKIVADYGNGFGTGSVLTVRLDTDKGNLSFHTQDSDWGIAFENIPKLTIYPAFSLHEKDDQISVLYCAKVDTQESNAVDVVDSVGEELLSTDIRHFIEANFIQYMLSILYVVDGLISQAVTLLNDPIKCYEVLSHPILCMYFPSFTAYLSSNFFQPMHLSRFAFQLLPFLTVVSKRLSGLYDRLNKVLPIFDVGEEFTSYIEGIWLFRSSSTSSQSFRPSEYAVRFSPSLTDQRAYSNDVDGDFKSSPSSAVNKVIGSGQKNGQTVSVSGSQYGTRLKLFETWNSSDYCVVEGRLSLCGSFLAGRFKVESGKMGVLEGIKLSAFSGATAQRVKSSLFKAALLCVSAVGKLASNLIIANQSSSTAVLPSGKGERSMSIDPADEIIVDTSESTNDKNDSKETAQVLKWVRSNLFSGGFDLDSNQKVQLSDKVLAFLDRRDYTAGAGRAVIEETSHAYIHDINLWWLQNHFPSINETIKAKYWNPSVEFRDNTPAPTEADSLLMDIVQAKNDGLILDEYISLHAGQSSLIKIGGEPMQRARKLVMAALVKHSGCSDFCVAEARAIIEGKREKSDRPNAILMEIWRAGQRVIERTLRQKQETGSTFEELAKLLIQKAEVLMELKPNKYCVAVKDSLMFVDEEQGSKDWSRTEIGLDVQQDCYKLLSEVVEFLISPLQNVNCLRNEMMKFTFSAINRLAGFRSISSLLGAEDEVPALPVIKLPPLTSVNLVSAPIVYILHSLREIALANSNNYFDVLNNASSSGAGHYLDGIYGVSSQIISMLQGSFESVLESITRQLSRCTWAGDRDGQIIALSAWGVQVKPDDHAFLNQVGIFRVLQTVLDDARNTISKITTAFDLEKLNQYPEGTNLDLKQSELFGGRAGGIYGGELLLNSNKRLAQLALCVVHGLASQVANSKEPSISFSATSAPRLQKIQSGPDTLSKSLFDLMYAELFTALRNNVMTAIKKLESIELSIDETGSVASSSSGYQSASAAPLLSITPQVQESTNAQEYLDGENYIYRILRLLYLVSGSKNCQKLLSSPKWLSILISSLSVAGLGVQRRCMRLLRRLLLNIDPVKIVALVPSLFSLDFDLLQSDTAVTDDEIQEYISYQTDEDAELSSAEKIVSYFMEAVTVTLPIPKASASDKKLNSLVVFLHQKGTADSFAADSVVVLRILFGIPVWRKIITQLVFRKLNVPSRNSISDRSLAAALSVLGGYIDRLRLGGLVTLKPFCLLGTVDNFATKLAAASHSCGMLVSNGISTGSVEVILMERGTKEIHNTEDFKFDKDNYKADTTIHHTTNWAGSIPIRAIRLNSTEVFPCPDIPPIPCLVNTSLVNELLVFLERNSVPWLKNELRVQARGSEDNSTDERDENDVILQLLLHVFAFKAVCISIQEESNAEILFQSPTAFQSLLALSVQPTTLGNLSILECLEDRFSKLWAYFSSATPVSAAQDSPNNGGGITIAPLKREVSDSQIEELSPRGATSAMPPSSLRDLAAILSPFGAPRPVDSAAQAAALAQMLEMGLPTEWCEFALKRCNYNVEMATNMCLEHGSDMAQLIAEESNSTASREVSARRHFIRDLSAQDVRPILRDERRGMVAADGPGGGFPNAGLLAARNLTSSNASALVRQLLDMGFPPSWCARAMASSNNDLDAALGWVLTQDVEPNLHSESPSAIPGSSKPADIQPTLTSAIASTTDEENINQIVNPLFVISGNAEVKENLTCRATVAGFPSIGCRGYAVNSGKWYYELTVLTAGCVQVGWVDAAFTGMADAGQGVGDDIHSWAFDGWRTFIWHETSAEWGTRWAPGDIVGCAVDLNSRIMSFYLNGFSIEIGMGVAFTDFECIGGLCPGVSFNRNESIQFNFGSTPFKHGPPEGYQAYIDHVLVVRERSAKLLRELSGNLPVNDARDIPEDAFEECVGDKQFPSQRRYFQSDESKSISQESLCHYSSSSVLPKIPTERKDVLKQLVVVAIDLSINYCRLNILRSLNRAVGVSESARKDLAAALFPRNTSDQESENAVEAVLKLLYMTSCYSNRTKAFLQVTAILPPSFQSPHNLGSIFSTGGYPMLSELHDTFSLFVFFRNYGIQKAENSYPFVESMIQSVATTLIKATSRELVSQWKIDDKFCPVVLRDGVINDGDSSDMPSVPYAVWTSYILMQHFIESLFKLPEDESSLSTRRLPQALIIDWLIRLIQAWEFGLRCPATAFKICVLRMLSYIVQDLAALESDVLSKLLSSPDCYIFTVEGMQRFKVQAKFRLNAERNSLPVCSEYLQALLEFSVVVEHIQAIKNAVMGGVSHNSGDKRDSLPFFENQREYNESNFNWEAISGRVFTDGSEGWDTYTGSIKLYRVPGIPSAINRTKSSDRQEMPPELMIGCKVARGLQKMPSKSGTFQSPTKPESKSNWMSSSSERSDRSSDESPIAAALERIRSNDETPPTTDSISRLKKLFEQSAIKDASEASISSKVEDVEVAESQDIIGTVTKIISWSATDGPGSAREITWEDGTIESVRWGAQSTYDVVHVAVKDGKVTSRYPTPTPHIMKVASTGFGAEKTFGIILRTRILDKSDGNSRGKTLIAIIEWPDFCSSAFAEGFVENDGSCTFVEKYLISGTAHSGWDLRFGSPHWQPGTTYRMAIHSKCLDKTDLNSLEMEGKCTFSTQIAGRRMIIMGDIQLQKSHLFYFDQKVHSSNTVLSNDLLSVSKTSSSGQGCAFGTVGFSSGVHFWEFKIEQAEIGSIYLGVSEKPDIRTHRLSRWMGSGFVSNRTSFETSNQAIGERVGVYGDHFHTGDIVGVLLDMNKGRLSFFLDGLKYGEHNISDLGEAFDNLTNPGSVKPKTLYPIVGINRSTDRVTLTPRWLSSIGANSNEEYLLYKKSWLLLSSWSKERSTQLPFSEHMWIYREGWRNWLVWKTGKQMRIRTRCKISSMPVVADISPRACMEASVKLGLEYALYSGDHVLFSKSSGRQLGLKEEAIILGAFKGLLWYRLDAQQSNNSGLMESSSLAWCLLPADIEGMTVVRRRTFDSSKLPEALLNIPLPRLPMFRGGLIHLFHDSGAVVRDGLEIDTSDVLCNIPSNTIIYAVEKRVNASNINRYRVLFNGSYGWISEKMRGGTEEVMLTELTNAGTEQKDKALQELVDAAAAANISGRIVWEEVSSLREAVIYWEEQIRKIGMGEHLNEGGFLSVRPVVVEGSTSQADESFDSFVSFASTVDGNKPWSVEADMQLVEMLSKCASKDGVTAQNLSIISVERALTDIDLESSLLKNLDVGRVIARAAILRVANQVFSFALPYINVSLPEEKLRYDSVGSDSKIDIQISPVQPLASGIRSSETGKKEMGLGAVIEETIKSSGTPRWNPPCCSRRLRSLRRLLFSQTKSSFFESILDATTTFTPMHQDEYEDPREIKTIKIKRVRATQSRLIAVTNASERLKQSVFGQLHKELRSWTNSSFRRSYVGKGHGGQKRGFKVKFVGEGVNDYGGPYRAVFEQVVDEAQCDAVTVGGTKPSEKCLLPLLIPCPNKCTAVGNNQDKFLLSTTPFTSTMNQELMQFFGKVVGTAVRQNLNLALNLSVMLWRPLAKLPVSKSHLEAVDTLIVNNIKDIINVGTELEEKLASGEEGMDRNYRPEEWIDLNFSTYLPDGTRWAMVPGGNEINVNLSNWREYIRLLEQCHLQQSASMYKVFKDGLSAVVPVEVFPLFTAQELEQLISGNSQVDVDLIRRCTEYEDISPDSDAVKFFWEVLNEMENEEKTEFLRFVCARSRLPVSAQELSVNFKMQGAQGAAKESPDKYLPHAQTCFFSLSLPAYSTKEIMREKLLYAIKNSPNMDADVRLHNAEGWADS